MKRVLDAAPQLQVFRGNVSAPVRDAAHMLRNEAPFGPLRVRCLVVIAETEAGEEEEEEERVDDADLLSLGAAIRQHASLVERVWLRDVPLAMPAVLDAFIDAALERRISELMMLCCSLSPASVPALARLLGSAALTELRIDNGGMQLLDAPTAFALLAGALQVNTTLRMLQLERMELWRDARASMAVVRALTAHPSLQDLSLCDNQPVNVDAATTAGAALGALVAANAPALRELHITYSSLGDAGLAPLLDALASNTHLRALHCDDNAMSEAFARDTFLPAIRANGSLRELVASEWWGGVEDGVAPEEVLQAEALVNGRAKAEAVPV